MPRYVAFLRGVGPLNAKMPELKQAFEAGGFVDVTTVLGSGNVVFSTTSRTGSAALAQRAEAAMTRTLGHSFRTFVRPVDALQELILCEPFTAFDLPADTKPIVTFLPEGHAAEPALPIEADGASILAVHDGLVLSAYQRNADGPMFMALIERTFGKQVTTRTWETVKRCAAA